MAVRDVGIRSIIPVRFDDEIEEDNRTRIEIKNRLDAMERAEPVELSDLAYAPPINLEPIKIIPKKGEYGHPDFWKSEKELKNYMVESAKRSEKAKKFREDPDWVAAYNKRFPRFKTTVLPKKTEKIFDEAAATDTELYNKLGKKDPVRYSKIMLGRYDGTPMPKDYPKKTDQDGYRVEASPEEVGKLAEKMERSRQMTGQAKGSGWKYESWAGNKDPHGSDLIKTTPNQKKRENWERIKSNKPIHTQLENLKKFHQGDSEQLNRVDKAAPDKRKLLNYNIGKKDFEYI